MGAKLLSGLNLQTITTMRKFPSLNLSVLAFKLDRWNLHHAIIKKLTRQMKI